MDKLDRIKLTKNRTYLLDHLDVNSVIDYMHQELVLSSDDLELINSEVTSRNKVAKLLSILPRRSESAFKKFLDGLIAGEVAFIAKKLEETTITEQDIAEFDRLHTDPDPSPTKTIGTCREHKELLKYYCDECRRPLCSDCMHFERCQHPQSRLKIEDANSKAKAAFDETLAKIDSDIAERKRRIEEIKNCLVISTDDVKTFKANAEQYLEDLVNQLRDFKSKCFEEVDQMLNAKMKETSLSKTKESVELEKLNSLQQQIHTKMKTSTPIEMLTDDTLKQSSALDQSPYAELPYPLMTEFVGNKQLAEDIEKYRETFGEVVVLPKCVSVIDSGVDGEKGVSVISGLCALDQGGLLAVDCKNYKVKKYNKALELVDVFTNSNLKNPIDCVLNEDGSCMVSGCISENIVTFTPDGRLCNSLGINKRAAGLAKTSNGNVIVTNISQPTPSVQCLSPTGEVQWEVGKNEKGENMFEDPSYEAVNGEGKVIVTDRKLNTMYILSEHGKLVVRLTGWEGGVKLSWPCGVCVDKEDNIYLSDCYNHRILQLSPDGTFRRVLLSQSDGIRYPSAITFDSQGRLVVSCIDVPNTPSVINTFKISH